MDSFSEDVLFDDPPAVISQQSGDETSERLTLLHDGGPPALIVWLAGRWQVCVVFFMTAAVGIGLVAGMTGVRSHPIARDMRPAHRHRHARHRHSSAKPRAARMGRAPIDTQAAGAGRTAGAVVIRPSRAPVRPAEVESVGHERPDQPKAVGDMEQFAYLGH
jgi:hypothetical protein